MSAVRRTERNRGLYRAQALTGWIASLFVVAALLYLLFELWLVPVRVRGDSMSPAFSDSEVVLADRAAKYWKTPGRGDVVLFADPAGDGRLLKRIVGLPGETVDIVDGQVFIDGVPLDEEAYAENPGGEMSAVTVPGNAVFVLGDNRAVVYDSRAPEIGCVPYDAIEGVVRFRVTPAARFTFYY